ncbi:MAG: hypothetical protein ABEH47_00140, partial [Haloferacaceae archaeon]
AGDPDSDDVVTVTQDGVTVEKRFTVDEFPVPAVEFVLRSEADDPVEIRLVDDVPESFDMEGVGFHPEYDGDNWTAYRDHRVEYERTLDPGEEVTTVYGVRVDDPGDDERFLGEPRLEFRSPGDDRAVAEDVLGRETTQAVRDALAGEGELSADREGADVAEGPDAAEVAAAVGDEDPAEADAGEPSAGGVDLGEDEAAEPGASVDDPPAGGIDLTEEPPESGVDAEEEFGTAEPEGDEDLDLDLGMEEEPEGEGPEGEELEGEEPEEEESAAAAAEPEAFDEPVTPRTVEDGLTPAIEPSAGGPDVEPAVGEAAEADAEAVEAGGEPEPEAGEAAGPDAVPGSVVAALAAEIRAGEADEDDVEALRDALDAGVPRSVEVRIDRLQNRTEDLAAYTDALEAFIDEHGTGQEVLDDLDAETTALREDLEAVEDELDAAAEERDDLAGAVGAHDDRLSEVESGLSDLEERVATLDDELGGVRSDVADVEADLEDLAGDTDEDLGDVREALDDVEATMADLEDELEELQEFLDRMRDAFGS